MNIHFLRPPTAKVTEKSIYFVIIFEKVFLREKRNYSKTYYVKTITTLIITRIMKAYGFQGVRIKAKWSNKETANFKRKFKKRTRQKIAKETEKELKEYCEKM